jgi:hypothetical protein
MNCENNVGNRFKKVWGKPRESCGSQNWVYWWEVEPGQNAVADYNRNVLASNFDRIIQFDADEIQRGGMFDLLCKPDLFGERKENQGSLNIVRPNGIH